MQIRKRTDMTRDEALMLLEATEAECERLRQELVDVHRQLEAIGAGGVSAQRITGSES